MDEIENTGTEVNKLSGFLVHKIAAAERIHLSIILQRPAVTILHNTAPWLTSKRQVRHSHTAELVFTKTWPRAGNTHFTVQQKPELLEGCLMLLASALTGQVHQADHNIAPSPVTAEDSVTMVKVPSMGTRADIDCDGETIGEMLLQPAYTWP